MLQTELIKFNLKDRGRKWRGAARQYDVPSLVAAINSPACQERVKNRDMHGYYGHWVRIKFGMLPQEGAHMANGSLVVVEPAFITTHLRAHEDGTVEHRADFLDNTSGKVAARLFQNRVGGFSSAIQTDAPVTLFGFDYVLEPNYTTNRGYQLDAVDGMSLDAVCAAIRDEQLQGMMVLLDKATHERDVAIHHAERLLEENTQYLSLLSTHTESPDAVLDSTGQQKIVTSTASLHRMQRDRQCFQDTTVLPMSGQAMEVASEYHQSYHALLQRMKIR